MAKYNKAMDVRDQQRRSFMEKERMINKHYGSWTEYNNQCCRYDRGKGPSPKSPEQYLREENPYSGF